jgi:hypothetical protein
MCTTITRVHRTCQHPTRGTAGPPTRLSSCEWARLSYGYCPAAQRDTATVIALDSEACKYCDRCLIWGANLFRRKGMDPDRYVRTFGNSLAAILEYAPAGWTWSDLE